MFVFCFFCCCFWVLVWIGFCRGVLLRYYVVLDIGIWCKGSDVSISSCYGSGCLFDFRKLGE